MWLLLNIWFQTNVSSTCLTIFIAFFARSQVSFISNIDRSSVMFCMLTCALYPPLTSHSGQLSFVLKTLCLLAKDCCWLFIDCCYEAKTYLDLLQTCCHSQIIKCSCLVSISTFQMKMFHVLCQHHQVYTEKYKISVRIQTEAFLFSTWYH